MTALLQGTCIGILSAYTPSQSLFNTIGTAVLAGDATEANQKLRYRTAGTFSGFFVSVFDNTLTAASTITLRKNGANANETVSVGSGASGQFQDTTHTDAVAAGDDWAVNVVAGATGTRMRVQLMSVLFTATTTTNSLTKLAAGTSQAFTTSNATNYLGLCEQFRIDTTEVNHQFKFKTAGTLKNSSCIVSANARATATTFNVRNNTANTGITISVTASTTGLFEDTTHTAAVAVNDLVNYALVFGTESTSITFTILSVEFITTNGNGQYVSSGRSNNDGWGPSDTESMTILGSFSLDSPNTVVQNITQIAGVFSLMNINIVINGLTLADTVRFQVGGVSVNQAISIPGSTTGYFEDTTHTDVVTTTSKVNFTHASGAGGTNLGLSFIGILFGPVAFPPGFMIQPVAPGWGFEIVSV